MNNVSEKFHPTEILSVIKGKMLSHNHMEGIYKILSFLEGRPVWTHEIPRFLDKFEQYLKDLFPDLAGEVITENFKDPKNFKDQELFRAWIADIENKYGKEILVSRKESENNNVE